MGHKHTRKEAVYNFILETAKDLAAKKLGALFVIAPKNKFKNIYEPLYPQVIGKHKITESGAKELILKLAELDGAFLIGDDGTLIAFGARIETSRALKGYGTKHAAATGITSHIKNSTAVLVSEETNWIKIFKKGSIVIKMDSSKTPKSVMHNIVTFLTDNDTALLATAGVTAAIVGFLPVVVVSGTYIAIKTATGVIKKSFRA